ncbi:MAG: hypothetical protein JNG89_11365, partial [Planctomycetaceae bacterium]|nr:hypothetical protein [Planctomycetaceae bacterium]
MGIELRQVLLVAGRLGRCLVLTVGVLAAALPARAQNPPPAAASAADDDCFLFSAKPLLSPLKNQTVFG